VTPSFKQDLTVALLILVLAAAASAADEPVRIEPQQAAKNLAKVVDPTLPPLAKQLGISGTVVLDTTISSDGKVIAIKAISGHPVLIQAVIDAVRKWEYRPFSQGGQPITVITRVDWVFPSAATIKSEEKASRDYYPAFDECYNLVRARKHVEAEAKCSQAVQIANQLPAFKVLERSSSYTFLAHSLFNQGKVRDSIPLYQKAIELRATVDGADQDADFASENANLARAYFQAGELEKADPLYDRAVTVFEAAIVALPDMKDRYTSRLKTTLQEYATLKDAGGRPDQARELEQKASALPTK
jgi:TonB family protein